MLPTRDLPWRSATAWNNAYTTALKLRKDNVQDEITVKIEIKQDHEADTYAVLHDLGGDLADERTGGGGEERQQGVAGDALELGPAVGQQRLACRNAGHTRLARLYIQVSAC